ncbi:heavy metal translocatin [Vararia minispora EC-137]|uniref:Heavy metal translocatin n=1 Tax=Vararia minispora EC-137 TaxID=1314806 RepID=A0ACB8QSP4_9AGAM|nr:heavy metal translocatin [Vararia minispora EC-137]
MLMSVQGMDCPSCAQKVTRALLSLSSVSDVKVNSFTNQATLAYTEGLILPANIAKRTTELTGFTCTVLEETPSNGGHRTMHIGVSASADIAWEKADLPSMVCVRGVVTDKTRIVLDVEYDARLIKPRDVLMAFRVWDGVFVPAPRPSASAQKDVVALFKRTSISAILCIPVLVFSWAQITPRPIVYGACSLALTTAIQCYVAAPIYSTALRSLFLQRILDMDLLIVLSTSVSYIFSVVAYFMLVAGHAFSEAFFETPALLITLITLGRLISAFARRRATSALAEVQSLQVDTVELFDATSGVISTIPADLVHAGDVLLVRADTLVPTDGTVVSGHSQVDESSVTGESAPVEKIIGATLTAGTLNGSGVLQMKVARIPSDNTIADLGRMLTQVQDGRLPVQDLADRAAAYLAPAILLTSVIVFAVWIAVGVAVREQNSRDAGVAALRYAVAVMIISCPCALVLCVPMVVVIAAGVAGKNGVVFKSIEAVQHAKGIQIVVLDKTGTLTTGRLSVVQAHVLREDQLDTIHALVSASRHPVSQSVAEYVLSVHPDVAPTELRDIQSIPGCGMTAKRGETVLRGGSSSWLGIDESHPAVVEMHSHALTVFAVTLDGTVLAVFGLSDTVRPSAPAAVKFLQDQGCEIYVVSGDAQPVVSALATRLGIPRARAFGKCFPQKKLEHVRSLQADQRKVMFVGDGTNDSLALAQADVGVSLSSGTDLALSTADVVLLDPERSADLARALRVLLGVSRAAVRRIAINFGWAFLYNFFAVLLAAGAFVEIRIAPQYAGLGEMVSVVPVVLVAWSLWLAKW